jgi:F420H(2)-dependent quinone reductase
VPSPHTVAIYPDPMPLTGEHVPGTSDWTNDQVARYERSDGEDGGDLRGMPVIVLGMTGARTGAVRKIALMRVEHDGRYAVIASKGGADENPVWYRNLVAHPRVELRDRATVREYDAREVDGHERAEWWERAVAAYPDYADYQQKTGRVIPVFVLDPAETAVDAR